MKSKNKTSDTIPILDLTFWPKKSQSINYKLKEKRVLLYSSSQCTINW